ncbi:MAG: tRNA pseudouridine(55) synthase TruB [Pseudomonadales bacterium]|nr:tRNA pseudouridine(55) synthase TruB [Pseudomonadales bacterium]
MGSRRKKGRLIDGVFLLNKDEGVTSNFIMQKVKRLFDAQKAGHTGSLDPLATGVLPICLGEATKFAARGLDANKGYEATAKLGQITETGDREGALVKCSDVPELSWDEVEAVIQRFSGVITQVPSMYSALKYQGKPLYEYARAGQVVPRKSREIQIFEIELLRFEDDEFDIRVFCSKGTYIRTLVEDIGLALGCGAHVTKLHRIQAGPFSIEQCMSLAQLSELLDESEAGKSYSRMDETLLPLDEMLSDLPILALEDTMRDAFVHGQSVRVSQAEITRVFDHQSVFDNQSLAVESEVRVYGRVNDNSCEQQFLGLASLTIEGDVNPRRLIAFSG